MCDFQKVCLKIGLSGRASGLVFFNRRGRASRVRMMNMETQLASLSSLVHSALMAKNVSDTVYKDIDMLRREILGTNGIRDDCSDNGSISRFSDRMSDNSQNIKFSRFFNSQSNNKTDYQQMYRQNQQECLPVKVLSPDAQLQLKNMKKRIVELNGDFRHLKRTVQLNSQTTCDTLKDSFDRIKLILNTNKQLHLFSNQTQQQQMSNDTYISSDRVWVNQEQDKYRSEFPSLQQRLKYVMTSEMDKVVREEKFLKDEPVRLDSALQKCKRLANTMLTMKKDREEPGSRHIFCCNLRLAIVQDRPTTNGHQTDRGRPSSATPQSPQNTDTYFSKSIEAPPLPPPPKNYPDQNGHTPFVSVIRPSRAVSDTKLFANKTIPNSGTQLLDELQSVSAANGVQQEKRRIDFAERFKNAASSETTASKIILNGSADSHDSNFNTRAIVDQPSHGNTRYGSESPNPVNRPQDSSFTPKRCQSTTPMSQPSSMVPPPPPRNIIFSPEIIDVS
uniref:Actin interacting protein 3-like C-terminal domain-containing protein n=1 Tax=Romanomermis culicivorax TaxID=13658 RepID=A0A915KMQ2_ROMCU